LEEIITLPVAHAEGKFVVKSNEVFEKVKKQIVFQYVDERGEDAGYPYNPNGSILGIAGIGDRSGRILGLMPHPERYISPLQHPAHTRKRLKEKGDGFRIFLNAVEYAKEMR
jgi:phosphoribosylformylglycinamidine synthase